MDHKSPERVKRAWLRRAAARMKADIEADPDSQQADAAEMVLDAWHRRPRRRQASRENYWRFATRKARIAGGFNDATVAELVHADHANERV
jgi:hypothetical protein